MAELTDGELPGVAERVRDARNRSGLTRTDLARRLAINQDWVRDLEDYDDDLPGTLTLLQVCDLAALMSVAPRRLICGDDAPDDGETLSEREVGEAISAALAQQQTTPESFGDQVGWNVDSVVGDPSRMWIDWNLHCLADVTSALKMDWRVLLPASIDEAKELIHRVQALSAALVTGRVGSELDRVGDVKLRRRIEELLVPPYCIFRSWNYSHRGACYPCWTILEHRPSNTAIVYCEEGFGPAEPWGLLTLTGRETDMGMDSLWYLRLEDALRASAAWDGPLPPGYEVP